jgi:uncharacterized protein YxjI
MRYLVRERLFSIREDFWVTDQHGRRAFFVVGKALSFREAFRLKDARGRRLATIRKRLLTFTDAMEIRHRGSLVARVHKAVISPLHHRAIIDIRGRGRLEAIGNIINKDFEIRDGRHVIARISRAWFRIRDTFGVDVAPGENDALILCIAICLDRIHHDMQRHS